VSSVDPFGVLQDEGLYRWISLIVPIVVALIGLYGALHRGHDGGAPVEDGRLRRLRVTIPLLILSLFIIVPYGYSFYNRAQQPSYELRMKRAEDFQIARSMLSRSEELSVANQALHFTSFDTTYFILGNDGYKLTESEGLVLPNHRGRRESYFLHLPFASESREAPREMFLDRDAGKKLNLSRTPFASERGTHERWVVSLPRDTFSILSLVAYPKAVTRRDEHDYIFTALYVPGRRKTLRFQCGLRRQSFRGRHRSISGHQGIRVRSAT